MMENLERNIKAIIADDVQTVDERISHLLDLRDEKHNDDEKHNANVDVTIFPYIINLLESETESPKRDLELGQVYTMLAEAFDDLDDYRPIDECGRNVYNIFVDASFKDLDKDVITVLTRLIEVVEDTVFNHLLKDLLTLLFHIAIAKELPLDPYKRFAEKLLKLDILLEHEPFERRRSKVERAFTTLFTREELINIIINPTLGHLRCDPVEYTCKWENIYYDVADKLDRMFKDEPRHFGFCFRYWSAKRELLKTEYGMDWNSPASMNPGVMFD